MFRSVAPLFAVGGIATGPVAPRFDTTDRHPLAVDGFRSADFADEAAFNAVFTVPPYSYSVGGGFARVGNLFVVVPGGSSQINSDMDPVGAPWEELWCNYSFTLDPAFASDTWVGLPLISDNGSDFYSLSSVKYDPVLEEFNDWDGFSFPYPLASLKGVEHIITHRAKGKSGATLSKATYWLNGAVMGAEHDIAGGGPDGVGNCGIFFSTRQADAGTFPNAKMGVRMCDYVPGDGITPPWSALEPA